MRVKIHTYKDANDFTVTDIQDAETHKLIDGVTKAIIHLTPGDCKATLEFHDFEFEGEVDVEEDSK